MVLLQRCESYSEDKIVNCVKDIFESFGGIGKFASPGKHVVIKPNMVARKKPEEAATTHPSIVYAVAMLCVKAGADVTIAESPGGLYEVALLKSTYRITGIEDAAVRAGAKLNFDLTETEIKNENAMFLKSIKVLTPIAKADCVINIAKLKTHGMMVYTGAVKNLFGIIPGLEKAEYHLKLSNYDDFANCMIDICQTCAPSLSIIDAVTGMHKDGPTAGEPKNIGAILSGTDPFEVDSVGVDIIRAQRDKIPILRNAIKRGLCTDSSKDIIIKGESIENLAIDDFVVRYNDGQRSLHFVGGILGKTLESAIRPRPVFHSDICKACGECAKCCPAHVISVDKKKGARVDLSGCIRCFCCQELCPFKAVDIRRPLLNKLVIRRNG